MDIQKRTVNASGIKFFVMHDGKEVARAYLYLMRNDLHDAPFGFMEDVFVDESLRGQGIGSRLVNDLVAEARRWGCYKLIAKSRHEWPAVHDLYLKLGFYDRGTEFKIDF